VSWERYGRSIVAVSVSSPNLLSIGTKPGWGQFNCQKVGRRLIADMRFDRTQRQEDSVISETTRTIIEQAKALYELHKLTWETSHSGEYVSIEPQSGEFFFATSFDAAVRAARSRFPERISHTIRIGHDATLFIGRMES